LTVFVDLNAAGSGIPEVKSYLNGVDLSYVFRFKTLLVKVVGVAFAVAGGLAVGKEGPMVHSGAVIAIGLSYAFKRFRWHHLKRDFVSCGAAAGMCFLVFFLIL
jgi:chloride channel 7